MSQLVLPKSLTDAGVKLVERRREGVEPRDGRRLGAQRPRREEAKGGGEGERGGPARARM